MSTTAYFKTIVEVYGNIYKSRPTCNYMSFSSYTMHSLILEPVFGNKVEIPSDTDRRSSFFPEL